MGANSVFPSRIISGQLLQFSKETPCIVRFNSRAQHRDSPTYWCMVSPWGKGERRSEKVEVGADANRIPSAYTFFSDRGSQWHMKYERQPHSPLFIVLQERKKKDGENIYSRAQTTSFIHSLERKYMQAYVGCLYAASDRRVDLCKKSPL